MSILQAYLHRAETKKVLSRKPGEEGFSLIELVVVVAVLAILAAIAIPAFTNINDQAKSSAAANTLAQIAKECAVKQAQGTGTSVNPVSLNGYGLNTTDCAGSSNKLIMTPTDNKKNPQYEYNVSTGAKECSHNHATLTVLHGCSAKSSGTW